MCSDVEVEPRPGTAKTAGTYVLFEHPGPWSHDVLDGGSLGEELTAKLKAHLRKFDASLQLIRHPTREGRDIDKPHLYTVFSDVGITEVHHVDGVEDLLEMDFSAPGLNGGQTRIAPLLLVGFIGGLGLGLYMAFTMKANAFTAMAYAACEGVVLGAISRYFDARYPGVAIQALTGTVMVAAGMLVVYKTGAIRVTSASQASSPSTFSRPMSPPPITTQRRPFSFRQAM